MEIKARRWLAVWYRCPGCGAQRAHPMLTPTKRHREYVPTCDNILHRLEQDDCTMEIVERRYYTTFAIEAGVSFTTIAGTLAEIGPFKVCTIAFPTIRAFRKWVEKRRAEVADQARAYFEHERQVQAELAERRQREAQEQALLEEAEQVAYRRAHAVELAAEQVAGAVWPTDVPKNVERVFNDDGLGELDDPPF